MRVYAHGSCQDNPGLMAIGVSLQDDDGREVETISLEIGQGTNNQAEYLAASEGVGRAYVRAPSSVELIMDSELVIKQLTGEYQVRHLMLQELYAEWQRALRKFQSVSLHTVPRHEHLRADALARAARVRETAAV